MQKSIELTGLFIFFFIIASPLETQTVENELQTAYRVVVETKEAVLITRAKYLEAIVIFNRELEKANPAPVPDLLLSLTAQNIVNTKAMFIYASKVHVAALANFTKAQRRAQEEELATNE